MIGFNKEKRNTQIFALFGQLVLGIHIYLFGLYYLLYIIPISLICYHVGHSIFMHRHLAHGQFKFTNKMQFILHIIAITCNMGKIPGYVAIHTQHHLHSGDKEDPHEWRLHGFWPIFFSEWHIEKSPMYKKWLVSSFKLTPYMKFFTNNHYLLLSLMLPITGGIVAMCWWWKQFSVIVVHLNLGDMSHRKGNDTSTNNSWLWPIMWGDEQHTEHHLYPRRERLCKYDLLFRLGKLLEGKTYE